MTIIGKISLTKFTFHSCHDGIFWQFNHCTTSIPMYEIATQPYIFSFQTRLRIVEVPTNESRYLPISLKSYPAPNSLPHTFWFYFHNKTIMRFVPTAKSNIANPQIKEITLKCDQLNI